MAGKKTAYAKVSWNTDDVLAKAKELNIKMTEDEAEDFLSSNENTMQDHMIERGWDALEYLLKVHQAQQ
jgi:hypothetical protein